MNRDDFAREVTSEGVLRAASTLVHTFDRERGGTPHHVVFSQRTTSHLDIDGWRGRARSFFGADVGLALDKRPQREPPEIDAALAMIHAEGLSGTRLVLTRPVDPSDLALARLLEAAAGAAGLSLLAERCPRVWLIAADTADDRASLLLATVAASFELGPIIDPDRTSLFGVRTARQRFEALSRVYR